MIKASTGLSADGSTNIATTNALDTVDGGAGEDTLQIENTGGVNTLAGDISNVENLTFIGAGNVNNNTVADVSAFSGAITLDQVSDAAVGISNVTGQNLVLDTVADGVALSATYGDAQASTELSNVNAAGDASFLLSGAALETVNLSTDGTVAGKQVTVTDNIGTGDTVKAINVDASEDAEVALNSAALENVAVSGEGQVTLTAGTAPTKTLSSVDSTGGVTYATALGAAVVFTGGAGDDAITFGATTKAQTMGAGDDTTTVNVAALGTDGSVDAGEGTDTLQMTAANAATASASSTFEGTVSNFEKVSITSTVAQTIDLANLDDIDYLVADDASGLTVDNLSSGGTFELALSAAATGASTVNVTDAASGEADSVNVKVSSDGDYNANTITVADVETVNIEADDTDAATANTTTLTVTADSATAVNVAGDAAVDLTLTGSTKVETVDASANTAGVTVDLGVAEGITFTGSAEADTVTMGDLDSVTGGEGDDTFVVTAPSAGNKYSTIEDFNAEEDTIQFADQGTEVFNSDAINLASTAVFQDYLDAAASGDATNDAQIGWFQFGEDTYVVADYADGGVGMSDTGTFNGGTDAVVKLTGLVDLSEATAADFVATV